jgi:hypothetical protein
MEIFFVRFLRHENIQVSLDVDTVQLNKCLNFQMNYRSGVKFRSTMKNFATEIRLDFHQYPIESSYLSPRESSNASVWYGKILSNVCCAIRKGKLTAHDINFPRQRLEMKSALEKSAEIENNISRLEL